MLHNRIEDVLRLREPDNALTMYPGFDITELENDAYDMKLVVGDKTYPIVVTLFDDGETVSVGLDPKYLRTQQ